MNICRSLFNKFSLITINVLVVGCQGSTSAANRIRNFSNNGGSEKYFDGHHRKTGVSFAGEKQFEEILTDVSNQKIKKNSEFRKIKTNGPVILLIESSIRPPSIFGRFSDRVDGIYKWNKNEARYLPDSYEYQISKSANELFKKTQAAECYFPAEYFSIVRKKLGVDFGIEVNAPLIIEHGSVVANILFEQNPEARIVIAPKPHIREEDICRLDDKEVSKRVFSEFKAVGVELKRIIADHKVTAVNLSHGVSEDSLKNVQGACAHSKDIVTIYSEIIRVNLEILNAVTSDANVLVVEAGSNNSSHLQNLDFFLDKYMCFSAANLLRIGFMTEANSNIAPQGELIHSKRLFVSQKNVLPCIDIVINSGFSEAPDSWEGQPNVVYGPKPLFALNRSATTVQALRSMATSWAAPHALSMALFIRASAKELAGQDLSAKDLKKLMYGKMFDPALNDQSEFYVGYRLATGQSFTPPLPEPMPN